MDDNLLLVSYNGWGPQTHAALRMLSRSVNSRSRLHTLHYPAERPRPQLGGGQTSKAWSRQNVPGISDEYVSGPTGFTDCGQTKTLNFAWVPNAWDPVSLSGW